MRLAPLMLLVLITSCTQVDPSTGPSVPSAPLERNDTTGPEPVVISNITGNDIPEAIANDTGFAEWEEWYGSSAATLLVTDGRQAARMYLPQGKTVELPLRTPINLTILAIGDDGRALITVNDERALLSAREDEPFLNGTIRVFVQDVIVRE